MRVWFLAAILILSGCTHYAVLDAADFDHGKTSDVQFTRDNYECQSEAVIRENMVGGGDMRGIYNSTYAACMTKRGYSTNNINLLGFSG